MKTQSLHFELLNSSNLTEATEKLVISTATDIFNMEIYKRAMFTKRWKKVYSFMGFSGFALTLLRKLNYWLEEYPEKNK